MSKELNKENKDKKEQSANVEIDLTDFKKQLAEKDAIIVDYTNHLKRLQAEFENYVKRIEKDRAELIHFAGEKIILKLLIVVDDFERAIEQMKKTSAPQQFVDGIEMVSKEFHKVLSAEGLQGIEAKGKKFDPYLHEVVTCVCRDDCAENTIVEEVQKGYLLGSRAIRYSKVIISKPLIKADVKNNANANNAKENTNTETGE